MNSRIVLGTVQFGLPYGVANRAGQIGRDEATAILLHASAMGLDTLDTAIDYGESEKRLGEIGVTQWKVISKLPAVPEPCSGVAAWVRESVFGSLKRLKITKLHGLLLHRPQQLLSVYGETLFQALIELKEDGLVEKIGVSVYDPDEFQALLPRFQLDFVQAPFNIVDRRLATSGWLTRLSENDIEIHIRSVFLQGLLLMEHDRRPTTFDRWTPLWNLWHRWLDDYALTPVRACLSFVLAQPAIDRVVVGVDTLKQLQEILDGVETPSTIPPKELMSEDLDLINPSRWNAS